MSFCKNFLIYLSTSSAFDYLLYEAVENSFLDFYYVYGFLKQCFLSYELPSSVMPFL